MQPTVGRMVYYMKYGTPGGEFKSEVSAAIITKVHSATCVDLCVINPTGFFFNQSVVQGSDGGKWDWMPYQKGQAARTDSIEAQLEAQLSGAKGAKVDRKPPLFNIAEFSFGVAVDSLKQGYKAARKGWNGKGMYIFLIGVSGSKDYWTYTNGVNDNYPLLPFLAMKTADDKVVPWLASQTDILAEDWMFVE